MANKRQPAPRKTIGGSASWLALVAATTFGAARADTVRAEIKMDPQQVSRAKPYRLIVQSYPSANGSALPNGSVRPLGSTQRAVTADDLARGVRIDLVEIADDIANAKEKGGVVVAWVEPGEPDLEFDARRARPTPGSVWGVARTGANDAGSVEIRLDRRMRGAA
jgi:hypothetical protein